MISAIHAVWPLMLGFFFVMLGQGLHTTLVGLRADVENFDPTTTGIVISFYTVGVMIGTFITGRLIQRIGHIRAYAVASALASTAMLMYILVITPVFWSLSRLLIGMSMAIIYASTESWLNDGAENHNRGAFLSVYMVTTNLGLGFGQYLLLFSPPENATLFVLISILLSLSVIPILLTVRNVPKFDTPKRMGLKRLYSITPFGFINMIMIGVLYNAFFVMAGVYAAIKGFSTFETSLFVSVLIFAPALSQTPIGRLSDHIDRRLVIVPLLMVTLVFLGIVIAYPDMTNFTRLLITGLIAAGLIPIHGLVIAHTNDFMAKDEMVGASITMIRLFALGAIIAPPAVGLSMQLIGAEGYFIFLAVVAVAMLVYSVIRVGLRWGALDDQAKYVGMPTSSAVTVATTLNPEAETLDQGYTVEETEDETL